MPILRVMEDLLAIEAETKYLFGAGETDPSGVELLLKALNTWLIAYAPFWELSEPGMLPAVLTQTSR